MAKEVGGVVIISEIQYQGTRQRIRIETHERIRGIFYVTFGKNEWLHQVSEFHGTWKSERLDQDTLQQIECILIAAYQ